MNSYSPNRYPSSARRPAPPRKRRKKDHGAAIATALFLPIIIALIAACFILWRRQPQPEKALIGSWRSSTDVSGTAESGIRSWLNGAALGNNVADTFSFNEEQKKNLVVYTGLTFSEDGSYSIAIDEGSYGNAENAAVSALSDALTDLIGIRIRAIGMDEAYAKKDAVRALFLKATELTPEEYITIYGPDLLPPLSDLKSAEKNGTFSVDKDTDLLVRDGGSGESYVVNDNMLAIGSGTSQTIYSRIGEAGTKTGRIDPLHPMTAHAAKSFKIIENMNAIVGNGGTKTVKAVHADYRNNRYVSLRDIAGALKNSAREFSLDVTGGSVSIDTTGTYEPAGGENEPFDIANTEAWTTSDLKLQEISLNGNTVKYYTYMGKNTAGQNDCYISTMDLALLLDINMSVSEGNITIDASTRGLSLVMGDLRQGGFYDEITSAVVGDATTGEIFDCYHEDMAVPIASTTKLMTYAVFMDAVTAGEVSLDDEVTLSENAAKLSQGADRVIPMEAGATATTADLLRGMLIASSNECALALAEHVAGSEAAFVDRMKRKAAELRLSSLTTFYNCNGLPTFGDNITTAKRQNHMTARDMFTLASYILNVYPQITEITTMKTAALTSLKMDVKTTNALLYNLPNCIGLKTGTTNMAGPCLVSAVKVESSAGAHDIVSVVLGAEDNTVRYSSSQVLLKYGEQVFLVGRGEDTQGSDAMPRDPEELIRLVLNALSRS